MFDQGLLFQWLTPTFCRPGLFLHLLVLGLYLGEWGYNVVRFLWLIIFCLIILMLDGRDGGFPGRQIPMVTSNFHHGPVVNLKTLILVLLLSLSPKIIIEIMSDVVGVEQIEAGVGEKIVYNFRRDDYFPDGLGFFTW